MKIFKNILDPRFLEICKKELFEKRADHCWTASQIFWPNTITKHVRGSCLATEVGDMVGETIAESIRDKIPEFEWLLIQYHIWPVNSAISQHKDNSHKFGITIYLDQNWDIDNGGLFVYKNKHTEEYHAVVPTYNTMVLNDEDEDHLVTPVVNGERHTIQIWGK